MNSNIPLKSCAALGVFAAIAVSSTVLAASKVSLDGEWKLDYWPEPDDGAVRTLAIPEHKTVKATVPGNCELDLVRAGLLPEPEIGLNVLKFRETEGNQWLYTRTFAAPELAKGERAVLVFDGIDTLADVFLNGEKIGEAENMFIPHRFDVTGRLARGENRVQVLIRSVFNASRAMTLGELGYTMSGGAEGEPFRKAGYMGGWDIFPRLFVSGLWRGVRLEIEDPVRIDRTSFIVTSLDRGRRTANVAGAFRLRMPFSRIGKARYEVTLSRQGKVAATCGGVASHYQQSYGLRVTDAAFWWPCGFGESALYDLRIRLTDADGRELAASCERVGIRQITLERDDIHGQERPGQFLFRVNGERCYIRGTNWVPLDSMPSRQAGRLAETLALVKDLNCNMIRVWGGGVYEAEAFFDWCDENGVMVWQDFMTGCSMFPFDPDYQRRTREEVLDVVLRFRNRASLAMWSGNNENDGAPRWRLGNSSAIHWDPNDDVTSRVTIPGVIREFDVTRPYLPSSPYYSPDVAAHRAKPSEEHLWGARAYYKVPFYTNAPCFFASEMGYHGCPNRETIERMMTKACVYPWKEITGKDPFQGYRWNDEWLVKASDPFLSRSFGQHRNSLMTNQLKIMFGDVPTELDDFIFGSQFVQAEAMKTFVELFRSQKFGKKNGLIWWNVRDGWPQISDAVVDYYGGRKRAYYAIRNAHRNQLVMVRDDHRAVAVNDTLAAVAGKVRITDRVSGKVVLERAYEVPANGTLDLGEVAWSGQGVLDIAYEQGGEKLTNWFLYGEPPFDFAQVKTWFR